MSRKLRELRRWGFQSAGFRAGYDARDALIRLGDMLRQLRAAAGLTQAQLAARIGMTQPAISRIESGFDEHEYGPEINTIARYIRGCDSTLIVRVHRRGSKPGTPTELETIL